MNIIGTGLSGLVGSRLTELLSDDFSFTNLSLETGVDITDAVRVSERILSSDAPWVFHFAAYTNVQQAEADRIQGNDSAAWKVNVTATETIVHACKAAGKRLLYVDTDYAFDGSKHPYTETDPPAPLGWYAVTKSEGARRVLSLGELGTVVRISNPYRAHPVGKTDFVHKMLERLQNGQEISAPRDQLFVPTFTDDLARVVRYITEKNGSGIYHAVAPEPVSPYDAARTVAEIWGLGTDRIREKPFAEYFRGRAPVPQYAVLTDTRLRHAGIMLTGFRDGVTAVHRQES